MSTLIRMLFAGVLILGMAACGSDGPTQSDKPEAQFINKVEVVYHSYEDHDPFTGDWVTFHVKLATPDGSVRGCALQSTAIRPYGSDCPDVGSTVDKIGPSTFRAYLFNVWVNRETGDPKHVITAGESVKARSPSDVQTSLATGNNITIAGAFDEEVKVLGTCGNCVYGQYQGREFRVRPQ